MRSEGEGGRGGGRSGPPSTERVALPWHSPSLPPPLPSAHLRPPPPTTPSAHELLMETLLASEKETIRVRLEATRQTNRQPSMRRTRCRAVHMRTVKPPYAFDPSIETVRRSARMRGDGRWTIQRHKAAAATAVKTAAAPKLRTRTADTLNPLNHLPPSLTLDHFAREFLRARGRRRSTRRPKPERRTSRSVKRTEVFRPRTATILGLLLPVGALVSRG
jgi:hypothetical protein